MLPHPEWGINISELKQTSSLRPHPEKRRLTASMWQLGANYEKQLGPKAIDTVDIQGEPQTKVYYQKRNDRSEGAQIWGQRNHHLPGLVRYRNAD